MNRSSSEENQQTIAEVSEKLDAQEQREPRAPFDWRWLAGLSAVIFMTALLAAVLIYGVILRNGQQEIATADRNRDERTSQTETCRARYASRVTNAQVNNDIAVDDVVLFLNTPPDLRDEAIRGRVASNLKKTRSALDLARDERLEFEERVARDATKPEGTPLEAIPCAIDGVLPLIND